MCACTLQQSIKSSLFDFPIVSKGPGLKEKSFGSILSLTFSRGVGVKWSNRQFCMEYRTGLFIFQLACVATPVIHGMCSHACYLAP